MFRATSTLLLLASSTFASSATASPAPPPPAFIDNIARQLMQTQTSASFDQYAGLLADDLTVTLDGNMVAANKAEWLKIERYRLGKIDRSVYGYAEGRNNLLVFERFDDRSDERCPQGGTCVFDPRYHSRAVQYQFGPDHLVHFIRIVQSDGFLRTQ